MDFTINNSDIWDSDAFSSTLHKALFDKPKLSADRKKGTNVIKKKRKSLPSIDDKQVISNSTSSRKKKQKQMIDVSEKSSKVSKSKKPEINQSSSREFNITETLTKSNKYLEEKQNHLARKQKKPNKRNKYKHLIQHDKAFQNSTSSTCLQMTESVISETFSEKISDFSTSFDTLNVNEIYQSKQKKVEKTKNSTLVKQIESTENILMVKAISSSETAKRKKKKLKKNLPKILKHPEGLKTVLKKNLGDKKVESTLTHSVRKAEDILLHPVKQINAKRKKKRENCLLDIAEKSTFDKEPVAKKSRLPIHGLQCKFEQFNQEKLQKVIKNANIHHNAQQPSSQYNAMETSNTRSLLLKEKATKCLQAAKFRFLNQKLYTVTGNEALNYFSNANEEFLDYHKGYHSQVEKWPINPVDIIIEDLSSMSKTLQVADLGCGDAKIARTFPKRKVHSFDLVSLNEHVTACDMAKIPLQDESVDVAVFCLSLMGTNLNDYIFEAYRILKFNGLLKIAEVDSRIEDLDIFIENFQKCGFELIDKDVTHKMFVLINFKKIKKKLKKSKMPTINLKPCLYKKR